MNQVLAPWVREAAALPLAFAQVREDPLLDLEVVQRIGPGARILMIASGGCTAALLACSHLTARLCLVDLNPAQLALARLKLHLLTRVESRDKVLGHACMPASERRRYLSAALHELDLSDDVLGPQELVAEVGPDYAGRYERVFAQLRAALQPVAEELAALLALRDPAEQAERVAPATRLGRAIDQALDDVMDLSNLIALFGEGATRNRAEPFADHFAGRTRWALAKLPAADNPYLWQMYGGTYPKGWRAPWLTASAPRRLPEISWLRLPMAAALKEVPGEFDLCHLSNILDWLSSDEARTTLELAAAALRPGGWVLIRQLNSTLDIPGLGPGFNWHGAKAQAMHARDRSFFYRQLHLGRKR